MHVRAACARAADNRCVQPIRHVPTRTGLLPRDANAELPAAHEGPLRGTDGADARAQLPDAVVRHAARDGQDEWAHARASARAQRRAQHDAKARIALALVGVSVCNAFAPLWGPALGAHAAHPARAALERMLATDPHLRARGLLSTLDARCLQLRRAPLLDALPAPVDASLDAVERALALPAGTARTLAVERALVDVGVPSATARDAAHLAASAGEMGALALALERAVDEGRVDLTRLGLRGADALDRMLTDPHLALAFAAGAAVAPRIPAQAAQALGTLGRVGHALLDAKLRHDHALDALKSLHSGNPVVDGAGRVVAELAEMAAFGLTFLGPGPFLAAARGTDLLLVAAQLLALKTAVAGTAKVVARYSDVPAEIVAFSLGVAAQASAREAARALHVEADALDAQQRTITQGVRDAVETGDPQRALDAVLTAWHQATPREREAIHRLVVHGAERVATEAGHGRAVETAASAHR